MKIIERFRSWLSPMCHYDHWFLLPIALAWLWELHLKPAHFDEGINGWFVANVWGKGFYEYNAEHFHGPLYFYLQQLNEILIGPGLANMRLLNVGFGLATVALIWHHSRWLGRSAKWAALVALLSPAFAFFSRYAIHEAPFVFCQVAFSYWFWRYQEQPSRRAFALMATAWVGLLTLKETWIIFAGVYWIAYLCLKLFERMVPWIDREIHESTRAKRAVSVAPPTKIDKAWVINWAGFAVILIFAGWGLDPGGVYKFGESLLLWTRTGVGETGHEKPWHYWLELASRYEVWFFVALLGGLITVFRGARVIRFYAIFALGLYLAYSLVPYKTPWLILNFLWPATFLFGFFIESLSRQFKSLGRHGARRIALVGFCLLLGWQGYQSWQLNFTRHSDPNERYVYVQSSQEWGQLWRAIELHGKQQPVLRNQPVLVAVQQSWPLPYLFLPYAKAVFVSLKQVLQNDEDIRKFSLVLIDEDDEALLGERLVKQGYLRKKVILRDAMKPIVVFLRAADYADLASRLYGLEPL